MHNKIYAEVIEINQHDESLVIGELQYVRSSYKDTLLDIARVNGIGHDEIIQANPTLNRWLPGEGAIVVLPTRYILPEAERTGIIINLIISL